MFSRLFILVCVECAGMFSREINATLKIIDNENKKFSLFSQIKRTNKLTKFIDTASL